jgi:hypothetical protein
MPLERLTVEQAARLAPLIARFRRDMERQRQRDAETFASLLRSLRSPDNARRLREIIGGANADS